MVCLGHHVSLSRSYLLGRYHIAMPLYYGIRQQKIEGVYRDGAETHTRQWILLFLF